MVRISVADDSMRSIPVVYPTDNVYSGDQFEYVKILIFHYFIWMILSMIPQNETLFFAEEEIESKPECELVFQLR